MRVRWKSILLSAVAAAVALPPSAWANYFCQGSIDQVGVNPDGSVIVLSSQASLSYITLCSVSTAVNNGVYSISTDTCKGMLATVLRAQATGATVQWGFTDSLVCSGHTAYQQLTGLYWGPIVQTE